MMKKLLIRGAALLLIAVMMIGTVGCATVTDALDGIFKDDTTAPDNSDLSEPELEAPARAKETYTILLLTEAVKSDTLDNAMLVSFHTAQPTISVLQIPTDLYLNVTERSVDGLFKTRYNKGIADGHTERDSAKMASEAVAEVLSSGFQTPIDYYVNFTGEDLAGLVNTLGGIETTVPFSMGSLSAGNQTLSGNQTLEFLAYDSYSDKTQTYMDARKLITTAIFNRARESVETEMLSLFVMELRSLMTTDIPSEGGEDIFFVRKMLQTDPESFRISDLATQLVYFASNGYRVMFESNAVERINELLALFEDELTLEQFDPRFVFVDSSSDIAQAVYSSSATSQTPIYTAKQILEGALVLKR